MLTITRVPLPPSVVTGYEAEDRNGYEDGQNNIRGNDGHYSSHVYEIAGVTFCIRVKT